MPKIIENRLIEEFKDRDTFSREELFDFFRYFEPNLKEGTFGWRIYDLKNKNIIFSGACQNCVMMFLRILILLRYNNISIIVIIIIYNIL